VQEWHFLTAKMPKMRSPETGTQEANSHDPAGITFSGRKNGERWLTRSQVPLSRVSSDMEGIAFSNLKNAEKAHTGTKTPFT
jgi:hypothetical protein